MSEKSEPLMTFDQNVFSKDYDQSFTNTLVGRQQRDRVWQAIEPYLASGKPLKILELNGGTGEDALHFAKKGHEVLCTDLSSEMLQFAAAKKERFAPDTRLSFQTLNINQLSELPIDENYDLVFSNFGGLNCLSPQELKQLSQNLTTILKPNGIFIAVVMPPFCLLERLYFLLKLNLKRAFNKKGKTPSLVHVNGDQVATYFYSAATFYQFFKNNFHKQDATLVGLIPSYLDPFFSKNKQWFQRIIKLEDRLIEKNSGVNIADHYLIILKKRTEDRSLH
ncbi:MAG: class I SAM-dependent methyltransferase [Saprospiraceae bacterium]